MGLLQISIILNQNISIIHMFLFKTRLEGVTAAQECLWNVLVITKN